MHPIKPFLKIVKLNRYGGIFAAKLVKITRKSEYVIHPKHLIQLERPWYLFYIKKNDIVLDVGCGNGSSSIECSKKCKKTIGFDYNEHSVKIAKRRVKDLGLKNVNIIKHNAEKTFPFNNDQFNKVIFLDTLEHLNKRKFVLSEIKRIMKPDGILILSIPNVDTLWKRLQMRVGMNPYCDPDHKIEYTTDTIKKELNINGFRIIDMRTTIYDTPLAGIIDLTGGISLKLYKYLILWKKRMVKYRPKETTGFRIIVKNSC